MSALANLCDRSLDPLFWLSKRADVESAWHEHIPFGHWLVSVAQPRLIVELGVHTGVSYTSFCEAVKRLQLQCRCFGIDTWKGDEQAGYYDEGVFTEVHQFHDSRYLDFSQLLRSSFDDALVYFPDRSIDILHIDGDHTYEAVENDFRNWLPKLSSRGIVLFHDIAEKSGNFGVWRVWENISQHYPSFSFLHGHGLGMLAIGNNQPSIISELCNNANADVIDRIRARFSHLGYSALLRHRESSRELNQDPSDNSFISDERERAMSRRDSILYKVDLSNGRSLEIGPLHRPLILKSESDVIYVDHASTKELIDKYANDPNVLAEDITEIDVVVGSAGFAKSVEAFAPFSNIVASHVLEHVPDLLGWLKGAVSLLLEDSRLCLALPDRRYTFDLLRRPSTLKDIIEAHEELRTRPSLELVCDAYRNSVGITAEQVWRRELDLSLLEVGWPIGVQREKIVQYLNGQYVDVHCWVFSPLEFLQLIARVVEKESLPLAPVYFRNTLYGGEEFHLQIIKSHSDSNSSSWQSVVAAARDNHIKWEISL